MGVARFLVMHDGAFAGAHSSGGMGDMFRSARPVHVGTSRPVLVSVIHTLQHCTYGPSPCHFELTGCTDQLRAVAMCGPQGGAASGGVLERGDRKGMQRTAKAKLIDVNEVRALQQQSHPQAPSALQASDHGG